ncbi:translocation/assembly module TamB domain-containing protein [Nioella nitratireducens]|uniref:translocation/assembly module TamB domain-containing protein n=1 Tax=Nioella nitratireducens TaxID=1287720 RepID=UPI0008FD0549|nr:translocation/assembly module TamB domain-containing protein [Nioella nitratireducens]
MIRVFLILVTVFWAGAAAAQDQGDDRSRLVRFLEDSLSDGAARDVRIEGFAGALSATATLDRLTIADEDGIWLTLEGAELTWTRSALLRGALEVDRLAADRIVLARLPATGGGNAPSPEATPFQLPDLPVSINISELQVGEIVLGAPVLGQNVRANLSGAASLAGGEGAATLDLVRRDGPEGAFHLAASYANATDTLDLSLSLTEAEGGIASTLLSLPGAPSVALDLSGSGPLDDLTVDLALATDDTPRLAGQLRLQGQEDGARRITADVSGDLAPLMAPDYRPFFGDAIALQADAVQDADGGLQLDRVAIDTASLRLSGSATLAPDGVPLRFRLTGDIRDASGAPVRLPVPGRVLVDGADIVLGYDRARGNDWQGRAVVSGIEAEGNRVASATLDMTGRITPPDQGGLAVTAQGDVSLAGLALTDQALQEALGPEADLALSLSWEQGRPLDIDSLTLASRTANLSGSGRFETGDSTLNANVTLAGSLPDLAPFSGLAGQTLSGAAALQMEAEVEALSGAFDTTLTLTGRDLRYGSALPPALLAGETTLSSHVIRDADGLRLEALELEGQALSASAQGTLSSGESRLTASARLANAGILTSALTGPVTADLAVSRASDAVPWAITASAAGQGGLTADISGRVGLPNGAVDLAVTGAVPLALADPFLAPRSLRGTARLDLAVQGQPGLNAAGGTITATDVRVSLPDVGMVLQNVSLSASLSGARVSLTGTGNAEAGGRFSLDGMLDMTAPGVPGQIDVTLTGLVISEEGLFQTTVQTGTISVRGQVANGPAVGGTLVLGQTDILLDDLSFGSSEPIPDIRHVGESSAQTATRDRAGLIQRGGGTPARPVPLDLTVSAPARIFLRGRGLDAELGGEIRIGGTSANVIPSGRFELIRGRLSLLGQRFDLDEASVTLQGSFDPVLRVVAQTQAGDTMVTITVAGPASAPELTLSSAPQLPQDEILSLLLFGREASSLSPVQAIQLVDAVSGFAGGGGLIAGLRQSFGLDDVDLTTDSEGNAQVSVGRYLSDNAYTSVEINGLGEAELNLNLDLTPTITARGGVGSDGSSSLGVFYERDY